MSKMIPLFTRDEFIKLLDDPKNVDKFMALINSAAVIVGDFDDCGEVLQSNEDGMYDQTTTIEQLRGAIHSITPGMVGEGDYLPWLSEEQQKRLEEVATEVQAAGNGTGDEDDEYASANAEGDVETMTPRERLECLRDDHEWRCERLGFDPDTGEVTPEEKELAPGEEMYVVTVYQRFTCEVQVAATDEDNAVEKVREGKGEFGKPYYDDTEDDSMWDVAKLSEKE